jgi:hypothetical protein
MTFEEFFEKYKLLIRDFTSARLEDSALIKAELLELCDQYPEYEETANTHLWREINR